jgi:putative holliday junction resolvase
MTTLLEAARSALDTLPQDKRIMGLDLGSKTIGIATADSTRQIATARETIVRQKFSSDVAKMREVIEMEGIGLIVLGLPINMDGTEGPRAQSTRSFARNFAQQSPVPIVYWDERLSTAAVKRTMLEADMSRAKRALNVDKLAAAYILQSFLDAVVRG